MAEPWRPALAFNGLHCFEDFWRWQSDWFEPPNHRRGGWSGVTRCELKLPQGGSAAIFLKRQENHVTKTWRHPFRGIATLVQEFDNLNQFHLRQLGTVVPLYFGVRRLGGNLQAALAMEELTGFRSLQSLTDEWQQTDWPPLPTRYQIIDALAQAIRRMHQHRFRHNCLYPKHLFLKWPAQDAPPASAPIEIRIIDLEKSHRIFSGWRATRRDLDTLHRHAEGWRRSDRWRFLRTYLQGRPLGQVKRCWGRLAERIRQKTAQHAATPPDSLARSGIGTLNHSGSDPSK